MLVSYTYRSDEPPVDDADGDLKLRSAVKTTPEMKTFSFYTVVDLGSIAPREETKVEPYDL